MWRCILWICVGVAMGTRMLELGHPHQEEVSRTRALCRRHECCPTGQLIASWLGSCSRAVVHRCGGSPISSSPWSQLACGAVPGGTQGGVRWGPFLRDNRESDVNPGTQHHGPNGPQQVRFWTHLLSRRSDTVPGP